MTASTTLLYGQTRTAKTSQTRFIAERIWKLHKKKTRFITSDTGSMWDPIQDLVDIGIVKPLFVPTDPIFFPLFTLRKLRKGMMPEGGEIRPWVTKNGNGETPGNKWLAWGEQEDSAEIGAYVFEMASFGDGMLRDLREKNIKLGTESKDVPGLRREGDEVYASNAEKHYQDAQMEISDFFNWVSHLPVHEVLLTLHEAVKFIDDREKNAAAKSALMGNVIIGPSIPGKTAIKDVPAKVGMCLHMEWSFEGGKRELRAWINPHPSGIARYLWPAGLRSISIPSILKTIETRYPKGYMVVSLDRGIGELFDLRDETVRMAANHAKKLIE